MFINSLLDELVNSFPIIYRSNSLFDLYMLLK